MANELELKYGCNPNQKPARIFMKEGELPIEVLNGHPGYINLLDDVAFLILKFFDEYTREVRKHMDYEEKTVFKYVDALINGNAPRNYQISTFSKHHDQVGEKLTELKNIIIKYCPAKANENLLNAALFDIYACEAGLESHCKVEDYIFVPAILKLERRIRENEK